MSAMKDLEKFKIYVLEELVTVLNGMDIVVGEVGERMNEIYFVIGFYKETESNQGRDKLVIISDVLKLNLNEWDKPIVEFIYDVLVTLPSGYTVLGIFQWKYDYNEWFEIVSEHRNETVNELWNPNKFTNFIILPVFDLKSVICSLKIFALEGKNSYLIPDSVVNVVKSYLNLGFFTNSEFQISLPLSPPPKNDEHFCQSGISKTIDDIKEIIRTSLSIGPSNNVVYYYNINHRIRHRNDELLPQQIPVYFSRGLHKMSVSFDHGNDRIQQEPNPHFFSSLKVTHAPVEDDSNEITLNLQACIFTLLSPDGKKDDTNIDELKEQVRLSFISKCNYINYRYFNRSPLFFCKDDNQFSFYLFKLPKNSFPVSLLNTGLLHGDIEQKGYRKRWSEVFNIKPLMPFISKNLALIPKSVKQISEDNQFSVSNVYCKNKIISPHIGIMDRLRLEFKESEIDLFKGSDHDFSHEPCSYVPKYESCFAKSQEPDNVYNLKSETSETYLEKTKCLNNQLDFIIGDFYYYHFNQDSEINDTGWSCTYRTLQMVLSWYLINNYTNKHVLSIKEIQELIKETDTLNFELEIGSETVLGIVQVSFLLSIYVGIYSCIRFYIGVFEFICDYETIVKHFRDVGSPVILNLGDYSYLIVGIHKCKKNGYSSTEELQINYLIVDPQYFGDDSDDQKIYQKNAISWRDSDFLLSVSGGNPVHVLFPSNIADGEKKIIY